MRLSTTPNSLARSGTGRSARCLPRLVHALGWLAVVSLACAAHGSPQSPRDDAPPAASPTAPAWTPPQALRRVRTGGIAAPLPEGVILLRSVGELRPGVAPGSWTFEPEEAPGTPRRTIAVLPSAAMQDAADRLDAMGEAARLRVELTGTVLLHRGRNHLLVGMLTPLGAATPAAAPPSPDRPATDPDAAEADEIERRLRERLGPLPRGGSGAAVGDAVDEPTESRIVLRRGTVRRDDDGGGWRFVPDSAHGGGDDVALGLLPCALLERIERLARESDAPLPILLSGEIVRFRGRAFLLPTAYEEPRTGRSLRPGRPARPGGSGRPTESP